MISTGSISYDGDGVADSAPGTADCLTLGRVSRISGQMVELELDGPAPAPRALFVGVTDPRLRVEVATLLGRGKAAKAAQNGKD